MGAHVVVVTDREMPTQVRIYGPFEDAQAAATWAFHKIGFEMAVEFKPLTPVEDVDDAEKMGWIVSNYSLACEQHAEPSVRSWAMLPRTKVRIARLAKDRYGWDLRKILDLLQAEEFADI